jgi:hypothetical protein
MGAQVAWMILLVTRPAAQATVDWQQQRVHEGTEHVASREDAHTFKSTFGFDSVHHQRDN